MSFPPYYPVHSDLQDSDQSMTPPSSVSAVGGGRRIEEQAIVQLQGRVVGTVRERLSRLERILAGLPPPEVIGEIEPLELQLRHAQDLVREALQQKDDLAEHVRVLEAEESRHRMLLGHLESRFERQVEPRSLLPADSNEALPKTQAWAALAEEAKCSVCQGLMWLVECGCVVCIACVFNSFASQKLRFELSQGDKGTRLDPMVPIPEVVKLVEGGSVQPALIRLVIRQLYTCLERDDLLSLKCPICEMHVHHQPRPIHLMGRLCTALVSWDAGSTAYGTFMLGEDVLNGFFGLADEYHMVLA
ncbi:hypothetical protein ARMSODRAFT_1023665 [Armillaria solidipes]|uniref:Uncharacterized protein n=1 Tax=Armillaria solidipes TaxID=1076256 RepID=A0A2H3BGR9_9AGAR|nr:hypothetical protein ARMSODRAFT_1023665 [Armillaria solidipes]